LREFQIYDEYEESKYDVSMMSEKSKKEGNICSADPNFVFTFHFVYYSVLK